MNVNGFPGEQVTPDLEERIREVEAFLREQAMAGALDDPRTVFGYLEISESDAAGDYDPEERPEDVEPGRVRYVDIDPGSPDIAAEAAEADPTGPVRVTRQEQAPVKPAQRATKLRQQPKARTAREKALRDRRDDLKPFPYGSRED